MIHGTSNFLGKWSPLHTVAKGKGKTLAQDPSCRKPSEKSLLTVFPSYSTNTWLKDETECLYRKLSG